MITRLTIRGFRGIADEVQLHFAQITLLSGRNGLGKTTIFDALDWCLFGHASRVAKTTETIRNLYRPDIEPHVELILRTDSRQRTVIRTPTSVSIDGSELDDRGLVNAFIVDRSVFPPYAHDVEGRVRSFHYLEQADIRAMVLARDDTERIALYQGLLGVPHAVLMRSAMRRVRDRLDAKLANANTRLEELEAEQSSLQQSGAVHTRLLTIDLQPLIQATREALSVELADPPQADMLATLLEAELTRLRLRTDERQRAQATLGTARDAARTFRSELARREELLRDAEERVTAARETVRIEREARAGLHENLQSARQAEELASREALAIESLRDLMRRQPEADAALRTAIQSATAASNEAADIVRRLDTTNTTVSQN